MAPPAPVLAVSKAWTDSSSLKRWVIKGLTSINPDETWKIFFYISIFTALPGKPFMSCTHGECILCACTTAIKVVFSFLIWFDFPLKVTNGALWRTITDSNFLHYYSRQKEQVFCEFMLTEWNRLLHFSICFKFTLWAT